MDENKYLALVEAIVSSELPSELPAFRAEGQSLVAEQFSGVDIRTEPGATPGEFGFASEAVAVLKFVGLLWSTYEVAKKFAAEVKRIAGDSREKKLATLRGEWRKRLLDAGLEGGAAERITAKFSDDLAALL